MLNRSRSLARPLLLRTGDALYPNFTVCQGVRAWEFIFGNWIWKHGLTCVPYVPARSRSVDLYIAVRTKQSARRTQRVSVNLRMPS
jgi:hypothetical protein